MNVAKDVADNAATALTEAEEPAKETNGDEATPGLAKLIVKRRSEKEKADRVRDEVERYCEKFEKEVLRLFDRSYRKGDPRMMAVSDSVGMCLRSSIWFKLLTFL
jgi:molecular chaperone GrpE (heat shock protein)